MGPIQQPARPVTSIRPVARSPGQEKELRLPDYRRQITGRQIGCEGTQHTIHHALFLGSQAVPPHRAVACGEAQTCRRQAVDDLADIGIADVESEMVRDRSGGGHGIAAVAVSKQGERSRRRT